MGGFQQVDVARNQFDSKGLELAIQSMTQNLNNFYSTGTINEIGAIVAYGGTLPPTGFLVCDGTAVSRVTFSALFAVIGTTYGTGDGSTTFNLPNLKGRVPVGLDTSQTEFNTMGKTGGHKDLQAHTHTFPNADSRGAWVGIASTAGGAATWNSATSSTGTGNAGNLQPYQVVNYIIRYALPGNVSGNYNIPKIPYNFRAYRNTAFTTTISSFCDFPYDGVEYDVGSNYNPTTGIFTAPIAGYYAFNGSATSGTTTTRWICCLFKNGTIELVRGSDVPVSTSPVTSMFSTSVSLQAGDNVRVKLYSSNAQPIQTGSQYNVFTGYLISS